MRRIQPAEDHVDSRKDILGQERGTFPALRKETTIDSENPRHVGHGVLGSPLRVREGMRSRSRLPRILSVFWAVRFRGQLRRRVLGLVDDCLRDLLGERLRLVALNMREIGARQRHTLDPSAEHWSASEHCLIQV